MRIQPEKKRRRKDTRESSLSRNWSVSLFSRFAFILWVIHRDKWKIQSHVGSAVLTLNWNHAVFLHSFRYTKFSGDLHHLLAKRPANILWPFLMMISQSENLLKAPDKAASLQGRGPVGYNQENNLLSLRSNVINIKVNSYFSYMLVISISVYKGQGIWRLSSKYWLNNETLHWYNF